MTLTLAQAAVNDANIHFDRLYSYTIPTPVSYTHLTLPTNSLV